MSDKSELPFFRREILITSPQPKLLGWIASMSLIAFLPGVIIFYVTPVCIVFGAIFLIRRKNGKSFFAPFVAALGLGSVTVLAAPPVLAFLLLLYIFPLTLMIAAWPTALNFLASYWLAAITGKTGRSKWGLFVIFSALLGFNTRIPAMVSDSIRESVNIEIVRTVDVTPSKGLAVLGMTTPISYLSKPLDILSISGSESCMCFYWTSPRTTKEDLIQYLVTNRIPYRIADSAPNIQPSLTIDINRSGSFTYADYLLKDETGQASRLRLNKRTNYPLEPDYATERLGLDNPYARLQYIAHSNFWNFLVSGIYSSNHFTRAKTTALQQFIVNTVSVNTVKGRDIPEIQQSFSPSLMSARLADDLPHILGLDWDQKSCGRMEEVGFDKRYTLKPGYTVKWGNSRNLLIFEHDGIVRPVELSGSVYGYSVAGFYCSPEGNFKWVTQPEYSGGWSFDVLEFLPDGTQSRKLTIALPKQFNTATEYNQKIQRIISNNSSYEFLMSSEPQKRNDNFKKEFYFIVADNRSNEYKVDANESTGSKPKALINVCPSKTCIPAATNIKMMQQDKLRICNVDALNKGQTGNSRKEFIKNCMDRLQVSH